LDWARLGPVILVWVGAVRPRKQWRDSPLFTCNVNSETGRGRRRRRMRRADLG